jgi:hypothetical protein
MLDRAAGEALLIKLDEFAAELARFRSEIVAQLPPTEGNGADDADDLSPDNLLDTHSAAERFGWPRDSVARWCREGAGIKQGGRWLASIPRMCAATSTFQG